MKIMQNERAVYLIFPTDDKETAADELWQIIRHMDASETVYWSIFKQYLSLRHEISENKRLGSQLHEKSEERS